ncbi:hypothetical protein L6452_21193 [Arctium lappa]|uniref:Uncharacterized protein n=1 Tax=Arctium lappa TaxID=4217 RepID=A0ACB9BHV9_ARCLA|nr:hypothetical protein L6452_21193 [Arctium lappa]
MPRSRINENFIDKTFSIVANILLRIIPTISGEKEAFTYYRDGQKHNLLYYLNFNYNKQKRIYKKTIFKK